VQGKSGNGGAVAENDAGGRSDGMRWWRKPLGFSDSERERGGRNGVEERVVELGRVTGKARRGAGPAGAPAAAVAGAWRPHGGCLLPRSGAGARGSERDGAGEAAGLGRLRRAGRKWGGDPKR
jgi:hypothetical protein